MKSYFDTLKPGVVKKFELLLPPYFFYHSLSHTLSVAEAAEKIAEQEGLDEKDKDLVKTAALFHDSGFFFNIFNHEERSCQIAVEHLQELKASAEDMEMICQIIMATKMPHNPKGLLQEIICDADLDYLGSDNYEAISGLLYKEMSARGEIYSDAHWLQMQIAFLESHRYFTPSAKKLRGNGKQKQLERLKAIASTIS